MAEKFDLQAVIAETELEPFPFVSASGKDMTLPHMSTLSLGQAYRLDRGEVQEVFEELGNGVASELMDLPGFAIEKLIQAWMAHAGESPGKSVGSSPSLRSTARRSRPTSRRTTGPRSPKLAQP